MLSVGLTGGIGAGKSAVSALLAERGAGVVDADLLAREVVAPGTPGLEAVVAEFGAGLLTPDGALDRPALGAVVFGDEQALRRLNAIVHPLVGRRTAELVDAARSGGAELLVHDVPLLVENGLGPRYHLVVVVDAPVPTRLARLAGRGLPPEQAAQRIAAQATPEQRRAAADAWLDNSGERSALAAQVEQLHRERLLPYARDLAAGRSASRGPVELVPYDPAWPAVAARLVARLRHLGGPLVLDVEHIGSTAVPALAAKDIVDVAVSAASWAEVEALGPLLAAGGFPRIEQIVGDPVRPEVDPDPVQWRKRMHRAADPGRQANVHVRVAGSAGGRLALAFRDALRADAGLRAAYEVQKRRLAALHADDVAAYAEGKTPFVLAAVRGRAV